jgi:hypothetical protein
MQPPQFGESKNLLLLTKTTIYNTCKAGFLSLLFNSKNILSLTKKKREKPIGRLKETTQQYA